MKQLFTLLLSVVCINTAFAQKDTTYNKQLADSLGADAYGMKQYIFVILKTGTNNVTDKKVRDSLFKGHMANINHLAKLGKLSVAGPILKDNDKHYRGIFVLNVKTIKEAEELLQTDPTIKAGVLATELYEWYCSAALPMFLPYHDKVAKEKF